MEPQELTKGQLLLTELQHLKSEQTQRINTRDHLMYATLGSLAAVLAAVFQQGQHLGRLLLLPPVTLVLGWMYLVNDEKVSAIGRYIRCDLAPRLSAVVQSGANSHQSEVPPLLGWELAHRSDPRRTSRKRLQLAADLGLFTLTPLGALTVYWASGTVDTWLLAVSLSEVLAVLVLGVQIVTYADLRREPPST
ncbi:hypothetical protein AN218_22335 [Streptomyces nanshensis]|uniref:Integral membrane protein n=1 Tax=Streptomyces nanshensis TaxID=518642 RepID=A0A1E7KZI7_9ACTN|nr:hypothetical protein AN218_22335 [Streptomyces nanshensis]